MSHADAGQPVLDVAYIDDMRNWIGDDTLAALLSNAPEAFTQELVRITAAWDAGDLHQVREAGHRLKGSAGSVACRRLALLGQKIQLIEGLEDRGVLDALHAEIDGAIAKLAEYRTDLIAAMPT